jgi:hypothetical protein
MLTNGKKYLITMAPQASCKCGCGCRSAQVRALGERRAELICSLRAQLKATEVGPVTAEHLSAQRGERVHLLCQLNAIEERLGQLLAADTVPDAS